MHTSNPKELLFFEPAEYNSLSSGNSGIFSLYFIRSKGLRAFLSQAKL